jgi:hypothetical protein
MSTSLTVDQRTRRRRHATGVAVLSGGLAILGAAALLAWSWRAELPDPVASHWNAAGEPDGFSTLGGIISLLLGLGGALVLVFGGITWGLGQSAVNRRIGAAGTVWVALFISIVVVGSLEIQRGLADARDAGGLGNVLLVAFLGSVVPAIVVAAVVPGDLRLPATEAVAADAPRVTLVDGERATWIARVSSPVAFVVGIPVLVLAVGLVWVTRAWAVAFVNVAVLLALVTLSSFVVRVDRDGLTVRSSLGWPRYRVPLDEIVRSDVTQVSPMREFGGWGWRVGRDGRVGVVLRKGEALIVQRTGGRAVVVTVDGAATAAGLLNALADRGRAR